MKTIEVIVDADGDVRIDAVGFTGQSCLKATKALEEALGKTISDAKKPQFHQPEKLNTRAGG